MNIAPCAALLPLCMAASAFFSGIESGMLSVNRARLIHWVRSGVRPARRLQLYLNDPERFLAAILVGNNLVNVVISTLSASLARGLFAGRPAAPALEAAWAAAMAFAVLYFCEYLPKLFFRTRPLRRTVKACRAFFYADILLTPLTRLVLLATRSLSPRPRRNKAGNPAGAPEDPAAGRRRGAFLMTREYIEDVVSDTRAGADISVFESVMIRRVLKLQNLCAAGIMTPIERAARVSADMPLAECFRIVRETGHIRIPVLSPDGSRCHGIINALDELAAGTDPRSARCGERARPAPFVRASEPADNLLPLMRRRHSPVLFVTDEKTGRAAGIVTEAAILNILTTAPLPLRKEL